MTNMCLNEVLDLKECLEDIIEDMDPEHLSGMLSLCAAQVISWLHLRRCSSGYVTIAMF